MPLLWNQVRIPSIRCLESRLGFQSPLDHDNAVFFIQNVFGFFPPTSKTEHPLRVPYTGILRLWGHSAIVAC